MATLRPGTLVAVRGLGQIHDPVLGDARTRVEGRLGLPVEGWRVARHVDDEEGTRGGASGSPMRRYAST
jgi:hypothetical protein